MGTLLLDVLAKMSFCGVILRKIGRELMSRRVVSILACLILILLGGCKAELIETKIKTSDIKRAISQGMTTVPFETKITIMGDSKDTRQQIKSFEEIIEQYVELDDVEI